MFTNYSPGNNDSELQSIDNSNTDTNNNITNDEQLQGIISLPENGVLRNQNVLTNTQYGLLDSQVQNDEPTLVQNEKPTNFAQEFFIPSTDADLDPLFPLAQYSNPPIPPTPRNKRRREEIIPDFSWLGQGLRSDSSTVTEQLDRVEIGLSCPLPQALRIRYKKNSTENEYARLEEDVNPEVAYEAYSSRQIFRRTINDRKVDYYMQVNGKFHPISFVFHDERFSSIEKGVEKKRSAKSIRSMTLAWKKVDIDLGYKNVVSQGNKKIQKFIDSVTTQNYNNNNNNNNNNNSNNRNNNNNSQINLASNASLLFSQSNSQKPYKTIKLVKGLPAIYKKQPIPDACQFVYVDSSNPLEPENYQHIQQIMHNKQGAYYIMNGKRVRYKVDNRELVNNDGYLPTKTDPVESLLLAVSFRRRPANKIHWSSIDNNSTSNCIMQQPPNEPT